MWYNTDMADEHVFFCQKYREKIDIDTKPCPHAQDYCQFRTGCVIHEKCMENPECREKRRRIIENTR